MNLFYAAKRLGGDVAGRNHVLCPGPGHTAGDRSLSVTFTNDGFIVFSHAGDDWRECKDHVRGRLGLDQFTPVAQGVAPVVPISTPQDRDRTARAVSIWKEARAITGTLAEAYLASRGLSYHGEALRFHPACPFNRERLGCMVALVRNIVSNEPQAIHRTALDASGRKMDRKALGPIAGGTVKLSDDADITSTLGIGEGIETSLSVRSLHGLEAMPVWSVLSAGGISSFPALPGIESVWIAADNDASGTGQRAAQTAAERLNSANIETIILASTVAGADLNDRVARHA